jgi:hypothetical protein
VKARLMSYHSASSGTANTSKRPQIADTVSLPSFVPYSRSEGSGLDAVNCPELDLARF